jgi:uncharacterized Zn finger protein (UPF0148 family)
MELGDQTVDATNCPGCGHPMTAHDGRHCSICEEGGEECVAVDPAADSLGG